MFFFLYLIKIAFCEFRECKDMRFCNENIDTSTAVFKLDETTISFENNEFTAKLIKDDVKTDYLLHVYKITNAGFRFRVDLDEKLSSYRFDISTDDVVMLVDNLNKHDEITYKTENSNYILTYKDLKLEISSSPFKADFYKNGTKYITINSQNLMTIENGDPEDDETWETFTETHPNGKSAVGIDIHFNNKNFRLTGLSEGTQEFNLKDQTIRRYSRGKYSHYGYSPLLQAHCSEMTENSAIFWINPTDTFWKLSTSDSTRDVRIISESAYIDFILMIGQTKEITPMISEITGKAPLPPLFALGFHMSRWGYSSQAMVQNVSDQFVANGIPLDALWMDIDQWKDEAPFLIDYENFPNITQLAQNLKDINKFLVRIADPHLPSEMNHSLFNEANQNNYLVKDQTGKNNYIASCWPGMSGWPDFSRKEVREWWSDIYAREEGWIDNVYPWDDMNEPSVFKVIEESFPKDIILHDNIETRQMHSVYGLYMTAASYDGMKKRNLRPFVLTRSYFTGSQRYTWHWNGDNTGNYTHLKLSVDMMLIAGLCGLPYSGGDIGGYYEDVTDVLLARWFQASMLTQPFFREHNRHNQKFREPYLYKDTNPTIYKSIVSTIKERYRCLALWYTAAHHNSKTGIPLSLPMWAEFNLPEFADNHEQVLIDERLMTVPLLEEDMFDVNVTKPPGRWFHWHTGEELLQSGWVSSPIDEGVAFLRGGKILPFFDTPATTTYETIRSNLSLYIALDENQKAEGDIYLDDGRTYEYENGSFLYTKFTYDESGLSFTHNGTYEAPHIVKIVIYGLNNNSPSFSIEDSSIETVNGVTTISGIDLSIQNDSHYAKEDSHSVNIGLIVGVSVGVCVLVIIIVIAILFFRKKKSLSNLNEPLTSNTQPNLI